MTDRIRHLTDELAHDPGSPVFVELGELLRRRGQLDAALAVVRSGLERHPDMIEALDLDGRVCGDLGRFEEAERSWTRVLQHDPRHSGALKGLGYLAFRSGDLDSALEYLELALAVDPTDQSVVRALHVVRGAARDAEAAAEGGPRQAGIFAGLEGGEQRMLLVDQRGLVLGGGLKRPEGEDVAEAVAAHLAGVAQEAARCARLLDLGAWSWLIAEGNGGNLYVTSPTDETLLAIARDRRVPAGRLRMLAEHASEIARRWLTEQGQ